MTEIERLQAKREALHASLEQIVGQANRVNGAIAVIDELLVEARREAQDDPTLVRALSPQGLDEFKRTGKMPGETALREMLPVTVESEQESDQ